MRMPFQLILMRILIISDNTLGHHSIRFNPTLLHPSQLALFHLLNSTSDWGCCGRSLWKKSEQENVEDRGRLRRCRWRWWSLLLSPRVSWFNPKICVVRCPRWFTPIPDCPPLKSNRPPPLELWRLLEEGHLVTRTTHPYVICHDLASECAIYMKRWTLPGGRTVTIPVLNCLPKMRITSNAISVSWLSAILRTCVSSFWFQTFESMVAVLSPNLRLWETFDRIYCQVLHINCPTHRLPCHSLQSTNITCEGWTKEGIHVSCENEHRINESEYLSHNQWECQNTDEREVNFKKVCL